MASYQRLNPGAVHALLASPQGGLARNLLLRGLRVESAAKQHLSGNAGHPKRVDTGRLRASVVTILVSRNGAPAVLVGSNVTYARFVHDGTGLYGPRHARIQPVRAKYLRFTPKGTSRVYYVRSVRGMKPNHFLKDALRAART